MAGLFAWTIFGALIGWYAAERRGFHPVGSILGGAFLGIFSPVLFLPMLSGLGAGDSGAQPGPGSYGSAAAAPKAVRPLWIVGVAVAFVVLVIAVGLALA